ncbi:MAG: hypothetical protein U0V49_01535 [Saprospiraceae bacterium]
MKNLLLLSNCLFILCCSHQNHTIISNPPHEVNIQDSVISKTKPVKTATPSPNEEYQQEKIDSLKKNKVKPKRNTKKND